MTNFQKCLSKPGKRKNSVAVIGALFGDEGKGRITDELTNYFLKTEKKVIAYRDNGGSNAGHTVSVGGKKIDLHQVGSRILHKDCIVILGRGMVIHPIDLEKEIEIVKETFDFDELPAEFKIDEMATLCLDTHRAFEWALKMINKGSLGGEASTGRGISPAYADILYRFPVIVRDLISDDWKEKLTNHYERYEKLISGTGVELKEIKVARFREKDIEVGDVDQFLKNLEETRDLMKKYTEDIHDFLEENWKSTTPFVFEKAQAVGLDTRWCVYPDASVSNCCLDGITSSTEGVIDANDISGRIGVIKSTYTSSVGKRVLPTPMEEEYANQIREDANEYGATTGRPRDIVYMDIAMLKYFCRVGGIDELAFTHMDIIYDRPVKLCTEYKIDGKRVGYRPYQWHLDLVKPVFREFKEWEGKAFKDIKEYSDVQKEVKEFVDFISKETNTTPVMITYGPNREETILV